jgi:hypothetical protein
VNCFEKERSPGLNNRIIAGRQPLLARRRVWNHLALAGKEPKKYEGNLFYSGTPEVSRRIFITGKI